MKVWGPQHEVRMAFARAVCADDRAMVISSDNRRDRWRSLGEAVKLDEAFAVRVRDGLVAVDADDSPLAAKAFVQFVRDLSLTPVVLASGQPDRFHILCPCEDETLRQRICVEAKRLGLDVRHGGSLIRPPFAMHRSHTRRSTLVEPLDQADALRLLVQPLPEPLSPRLNVLLRYGDLFGDYAKRSAAEQALIEGLRGLMVSSERIEELLSDPANVGGHHFQERTAKGWGEGDLNRSMHKADERIGGRGLQLRGRPAMEAIEQLDAAARVRPWPGRTGSTDCKVYRAHLSHAKDRKRTQYAASVRDILQRSGSGSMETVRKAQVRLVEAGLLRKVGRPEGTKAQVWALLPCKPDTLPSTKKGGRELLSVSATLGIEAHDVFRYRGLGPGPLLTYGALAGLGRPQSVPELSDLTGKHRTTTKRHLDLLQEHGLAAENEGHWTAAVVDLDQIAQILNVAGMGDKQADRISLDRARYREFLDAREELRRIEMTRSANRFGGPYLTTRRVLEFMHWRAERRAAEGRAMVVPDEVL